MNIDILGLSAKRLNRSSFFLSVLVAAFILIGGGSIVDNLVSEKDGTDDEPGWVFIVFLATWWLYLIYSSTRRLHDLNKSGWFLLLYLVPILNLLLLIQLFFFRGDDKENKYGKPLNRTYILGLGL